VYQELFNLKTNSGCPRIIHLSSIYQAWIFKQPSQHATHRFHIVI